MRFASILLERNTEGSSVPGHVKCWREIFFGLLWTTVHGDYRELGRIRHGELNLGSSSDSRVDFCAASVFTSHSRDPRHDARSRVYLSMRRAHLHVHWSRYAGVFLKWKSRKGHIYAISITKAIFRSLNAKERESESWEDDGQRMACGVAVTQGNQWALGTFFSLHEHHRVLDNDEDAERYLGLASSSIF